MITTIQQLFPDTKYKIKFIFATKNYYLSEQDNARLNNYGIIHFDEETLKYYQDLTRLEKIYGREEKRNPVRRNAGGHRK